MSTSTVASVYLSRLVLNPGTSQARRELANPYEMHRTLLRAFSELPDQTSFRKQTEVLFRVDSDVHTGVTSLLVQSLIEPDWSHLRERNGFLLTAECKPIGQHFERLAEGSVLAFRLRANVTKKIDTKTTVDGVRRNGRRIPLRNNDELLAWLERKGEVGGYTLEKLEGKQHPECRNLPEQNVAAWKGRLEKRMTFASVLFEGRLRITDAEAFRTSLIRGVGPAKAFGFGLLSIAPCVRSNDGSGRPTSASEVS